MTNAVDIRRQAERDGADGSRAVDRLGELWELVEPVGSLFRFVG